MKSHNFLQALVFAAFLLLFSGQSMALTAAEAEAFADSKGRELIDLLTSGDKQEKYRRLDELFLQYVDLDYISRFVLGKYWNRMTPEQQQQYQALFKRYAVSQYKRYPLELSGKITFQISGSSSDGAEAMVFVLVGYQAARPEDNKEISAEFRMHEVKNRILLTDVKIAESSMLLSYRKRFYQMMKDADEETEWFLEDFADFTASAEKLVDSAAKI